MTVFHAVFSSFLTWKLFVHGSSLTGIYFKKLRRSHKCKKRTSAKTVYFGLSFLPMQAPIVKLVCDNFNLHIEQQSPQGHLKYPLDLEVI